MHGKKKLKALVSVMVMLCITGAWISGELLKAHAGPWPSMKAVPTWFTRVCGAGANGESLCTSVLKSDWSAIDFDIPVLKRAGSGLTIQRSRVVVPVAFMGLTYYVFLGVWFVLAGRPRPWGYGWYLVPLLTVIAGTVGSLALLWVMFFKIESQCTWCLVTHAINGLLLVGTLWLWPRKAAMLAERSIVESQDRPAVYVGAALTPYAALRAISLAVVLIAGLWLFRGAKLDVRRQVARLLPYKQIVEKQRSNPAFLLREYYAQPQHAILSHNASGEDESNTIIPRLDIFTDFQCPHCVCFARRWKKQYRPLWKGPLQVNLHHFPLDSDCNKIVKRDVHTEACEASFAAEAARLQGGDKSFWEMHDLLFANYRHLGEKPYAKLAARLGLDGAQLLKDMAMDGVKQVVADDVELASNLGIKGTPYVFLDGRSVPRFCLNNETFWKTISIELLQRTTDHSNHKFIAHSSGQTIDSKITNLVTVKP